VDFLSLIKEGGRGGGEIGEGVGCIICISPNDFKLLRCDHSESSLKTGQLAIGLVGKILQHADANSKV